MCAKRAPGMCAARYCDSPHVSGWDRSCRTSTITNDGSSRCAARSVVEISVVNMEGSVAGDSHALREGTKLELDGNDTTPGDWSAARALGPLAPSDVGPDGRIIP